MKRLELKHKYYLINEESYFEFDEGDEIIFHNADDLLLCVTPVKKDERGLYILDKDNMFDQCEYYETKKYFEVESEHEINVNVRVWDLKVDPFYFSFKYELKINDKVLVAEEHYEGDHAWQNDRESFYKMLLKGYAASLVLEREHHLLEDTNK